MQADGPLDLLCARADGREGRTDEAVVCVFLCISMTVERSYADTLGIIPGKFTVPSSSSSLEARSQRLSVHSSVTFHIIVKPNQSSQVVPNSVQSLL